MDQFLMGPRILADRLALFGEDNRQVLPVNVERHIIREISVKPIRFLAKDGSSRRSRT
ncbi:hypothetical protein D3C83_330360 [compost metagenome]